MSLEERERSLLLPGKEEVVPEDAPGRGADATPVAGEARGHANAVPAYVAPNARCRCVSRRTVASPQATTRQIASVAVTDPTP